MAMDEYSKKALERFNNLRKTLGMRKIKQGFRKCLNCDKIFFSEDLCSLKRCPLCREKKIFL